MMCYEVCETVFQIRISTQESLLSTNTGEDAYPKAKWTNQIQRAAKNFRSVLHDPKQVA